ncbi:MAG TPA: CBS domain-containing protein [Clostridiales bacterium]|jgi:acetoin utilization protein AcuB|nr:CBS domain-containing protein [Clostridiales bacterium]
MYIKDRMTKDPYTIQVNASISALMALMREKGLKKIPVLDGERVVGIVTDRDVERVSPSKATTLSVFEINYLLSKSTVRDAMTKDVLTVLPDAHIEDAAVLMRDERISALLVVDENKKLVGIVTESDLFDALIDMLGARFTGTRLLIRIANKPGMLSKLGAVISESGTNISHLAMVVADDDSDAEMLLRTDSKEVGQLEEAIKKAGFEILNISVK